MRRVFWIIQVGSNVITEVLIQHVKEGDKRFRGKGGDVTREQSSKWHCHKPRIVGSL